MKKILYIAAATILLAGCTKNEIVRTADNSQEISFSAYDSRVATKAANLTEGSFRVTATYKKGSAASSSYFTNEKYTWSTDKFVSAGETHYWPVDGGKLTFFATMPENNVTDATKKIVPDTTVTFHADGKTDFMAAYLAAQEGPSAQLAFNHKLTKVSFAAKGQDTGLKYVVKSITLTADSTAIYTMGTTGSWGTASNSKDYAVLAADSTIVKGTATYKSLGASQLVIPSSGDAVSLNVKYQVYDGDNLVDDYSASGVTVDLSSSAASWGINKSFRYCLTLGLSSSVTPITFNAEQTDWGADTEPSVIILPEAKIGNVEYLKLTEAYTAAAERDTIIVIKSGTYSLPTTELKNIIIIADDNINASINNTTLVFHSKIDDDDFTRTEINGFTFPNAVSVSGEGSFHNCDFTCPSGDMCKVYSDIIFNGCTFSSIPDGKSGIVIYNPNDAAYGLCIEHCVFSGTGNSNAVELTSGVQTGDSFWGSFIANEVNCKYYFKDNSKHSSSGIWENAGFHFAKGSGTAELTKDYNVIYNAPEYLCLVFGFNFIDTEELHPVIIARELDYGNVICSIESDNWDGKEGYMSTFHEFVGQYDSIQLLIPSQLGAKIEGSTLVGMNYVIDTDSWGGEFNIVPAE